MAPTTRRSGYTTPPPEPLANREATTTRKTRYYNAIDYNPEGKSQRAIARELGISESAGRKWKKQRDSMAGLARRSVRGRSIKLGRPSKVTKSVCKTLMDPQRNSIRKARYEAQIKHYNIPIRRRQLQRKLKEHTKGGRMYKCAFIKKVPSAKNLHKREEYGNEHKDMPIFGFWDHIFFTDEAHIDPTSMVQEEVLREQGTRYEPDNIQWRGQKKGVRFHVAG